MTCWQKTPPPPPPLRPQWLNDSCLRLGYSLIELLLILRFCLSSNVRSTCALMQLQLQLQTCLQLQLPTANIDTRIRASGHYAEVLGRRPPRQRQQRRPLRQPRKSTTNMMLEVAIGLSGKGGHLGQNGHQKKRKLRLEKWRKRSRRRRIEKL